MQALELEPFNDIMMSLLEGHKMKNLYFFFKYVIQECSCSLHTWELEK